MKIISNFLEKDDFNNLKNLFYSDNFPWYLAEGVVRPGDGQIQFIHNFYKNFAISSSFFSLIYPVLIKLNVISLIRIKANFLYKTNKIIDIAIERNHHIFPITFIGNKFIKLFSMRL